MNGTQPRLPPEFWSRPDIASALASCDVPALMEAVRVARRWFRRACNVGPAPAMRAFDRQLHETIPT